jgi:hypothetical protein
MNVAKTQKNLSEVDVLNSLENAISTYGVKDFKEITKKSLQNSAKTKRGRPAKALVTEPVSQSKIKKAKLLSENSEETVTIIKKDIPASGMKPKSIWKNIKLGKKTKKTKTLTGSRTKTSSSSKLGNFFQAYKKQMLTTGLSGAMIIFVAFSTYIAYAYVGAPSNDVVSKVGMHVVLPTTESPKVYIIQSEKSEIFQNPLFSGIKVGDNVLTYSNAGKVYIYRSSEDKIVNIVNTTQ